jgi:hypothetical protein
MFDSQASAYGVIWGDDGVFSFQPFETEAFYNPQANNLGSHVRNFNNENRSIRSEFTQNNLIKMITNPSGVYSEHPRGTLDEE